MKEPFTVKKGRFSFVVEESKGSGLNNFDAAVFTASCDTVELNTEYAKQLKLDYPILSDPKKETAKAYGVVNDKRPVPFRWTFYIGKDGKILEIQKKVNTAKHNEEIAANLKKFKVGPPKKK